MEHDKKERKRKRQAKLTDACVGEVLEELKGNINEELGWEMDARHTVLEI